MLSVGQFFSRHSASFLISLTTVSIAKQLRQILDSSLVVYCLRVPMRRVQRC